MMLHQRLSQMTNRLLKNTETALADIGYNEFVAFDITLVDDNGDTVQPNGKVEVSIPLPEKYKGLNNLGILLYRQQCESGKNGIKN